MTPFLFLAEDPSIDWVNTAVVSDGKPVDLIASYPVWIQWLVESKTLDSETGRRLLRRWRETKEGLQALRQAKVWRDTYRQALIQIEKSGRIPRSLVSTMNSVLKKSASAVRTRLSEKAGRLVVQKTLHIETPEAIVGRLVEAAASFLSTADWSLIRKCDNPSCVLHFYDASKNHARRWCSMQVCGNRHKAAAHYRKKLQSSPKIR